MGILLAVYWQCVHTGRYSFLDMTWLMFTNPAGMLFPLIPTGEGMTKFQSQSAHGCPRWISSPSRKLALSSALCHHSWLLTGCNVWSGRWVGKTSKRQTRLLKGNLLNCDLPDGPLNSASFARTVIANCSHVNLMQVQSVPSWTNIETFQSVLFQLCVPALLCVQPSNQKVEILLNLKVLKRQSTLSA